MSLGGFRLGGFNLGTTAWPNLGVPGFSGLLDQFAGAAAAYSLRKLSNSTGDVVRVRRSSDDSEQDFNATEVTDGSLVSFANNDTTDLYNNRMYFDGVDDYVETPITSSLTAFTISFNLIPTVLNDNDGFIGKGGGTTREFYLRYKSSGSLIEFRIYQDGLATFEDVNSANDALTVGNATRITAVFDASTTTSRLYVDGVKTENTGVASMFSGTSALDIGRSLQLAYQAGVIEDVYFYNSAISDSEEADIRNGSAPSGALFAYDGSGTTTWADTSGNGNDGTVNGSPALYTGQGFDGFVVTWYDQSGNSRDATQATTSAQPQIVSSGSLVTGGLDFNGTSHYLQANAVASALSGNDNFIDSFVVAKNERISGASAHYALGNNTNPSPQLHYSGSNDTSYRAISRDDSNVISLVDVGTFNAKSIVSVSDDGDTIDIRADGTSIGSDADAKTQRTFDRFAIGALDRQGSLGGYYDGKIEEVILYPSDQSGNLAAIEANLNAYYGIY